MTKTKTITPLSAALRAKFLTVAGALSPENLSHDGERPKREIAAAERKLRAEWKRLEKEAGRPVTEAELFTPAPKAPTTEPVEARDVPEPKAEKPAKKAKTPKTPKAEKPEVKPQADVWQGMFRMPAGGTVHVSPHAIRTPNLMLKRSALHPELNSLLLSTKKFGAWLEDGGELPVKIETVEDAMMGLVLRDLDPKAQQVHLTRMLVHDPLLAEKGEYRIENFRLYVNRDETGRALRVWVNDGLLEALGTPTVLTQRAPGAWGNEFGALTQVKDAKSLNEQVGIAVLARPNDPALAVLCQTALDPFDAPAVAPKTEKEPAEKKAKRAKPVAVTA